MNEDDEGLLSAFRRFEQHGGNPLFRAFILVGRNRSFRGIVDKKKYRLTLQQLRDAQDEPLGEAITKALIQGLQQVVKNEGLKVQDKSLLVAVIQTHSLMSGHNLPEMSL